MSDEENSDSRVNSSSTDRSTYRPPKNRQIHNDTERKRKEKIKHYISAIANLLPGDRVEPKQRNSTNEILECALKYIVEIREQNEKLLKDKGQDVQNGEIARLKDLLGEAREQRDRFERMVHLGAAVPANFNPLTQWQKSESSDKSRFAISSACMPSHKAEAKPLPGFSAPAATSSGMSPAAAASQAAVTAGSSVSGLRGSIASTAGGSTGSKPLCIPPNLGQGLIITQSGQAIFVNEQGVAVAQGVLGPSIPISDLVSKSSGAEDGTSKMATSARRGCEGAGDAATSLTAESLRADTAASERVPSVGKLKSGGSNVCSAAGDEGAPVLHAVGTGELAVSRPAALPGRSSTPLSGIASSCRHVTAAGLALHQQPGIISVPGHPGQYPSALILPNGQIIPVVTQPQSMHTSAIPHESFTSGCKGASSSSSPLLFSTASSTAVMTTTATGTVTTSIASAVHVNSAPATSTASAGGVMYVAMPTPSLSLQQQATVQQQSTVQQQPTVQQQTTQSHHASGSSLLMDTNAFMSSVAEQVKMGQRLIMPKPPNFSATATALPGVDSSQSKSKRRTKKVANGGSGTAASDSSVASQVESDTDILAKAAESIFADVGMAFSASEDNPLQIDMGDKDLDLLSPHDTSSTACEHGKALQKTDVHPPLAAAQEQQQHKRVKSNESANAVALEESANRKYELMAGKSKTAPVAVRQSEQPLSDETLAAGISGSNPAADVVSDPKAKGKHGTNKGKAISSTDSRTESSADTGKPSAKRARGRDGPKKLASDSQTSTASSGGKPKQKRKPARVAKADNDIPDSIQFSENDLDLVLQQVENFDAPEMRKDPARTKTNKTSAAAREGSLGGDASKSRHGDANLSDSEIGPIFSLARPGSAKLIADEGQRGAGPAMLADKATIRADKAAAASKPGPAADKAAAASKLGPAAPQTTLSSSILTASSKGLDRANGENKRAKGDHEVSGGKSNGIGVSPFDRDIKQGQHDITGKGSSTRLQEVDSFANVSAPGVGQMLAAASARPPPCRSPFRSEGHQSLQQQEQQLLTGLQQRPLPGPHLQPLSGQQQQPQALSMPQLQAVPLQQQQQTLPVPQQQLQALPVLQQQQPALPIPQQQQALPMTQQPLPTPLAAGERQRQRKTAASSTSQHSKGRDAKVRMGDASSSESLAVFGAGEMGTTKKRHQSAAVLSKQSPLQPSPPHAQQLQATGLHQQQSAMDKGMSNYLEQMAGLSAVAASSGKQMHQQHSLRMENSFGHHLSGGLDMSKLVGRDGGLSYGSFLRNDSCANDMQRQHKDSLQRSTDSAGLWENREGSFGREPSAAVQNLSTREQFKASDGSQQQQRDGEQFYRPVLLDAVPSHLARGREGSFSTEAILSPSYPGSRYAASMMHAMACGPDSLPSTTAADSQSSRPSSRAAYEMLQQQRLLAQPSPHSKPSNGLTFGGKELNVGAYGSKDIVPYNVNFFAAANAADYGVDGGCRSLPFAYTADASRPPDTGFTFSLTSTTNSAAAQAAAFNSHIAHHQFPFFSLPPAMAQQTAEAAASFLQPRPEDLYRAYQGHSKSPPASKVRPSDQNSKLSHSAVNLYSNSGFDTPPSMLSLHNSMQRRFDEHELSSYEPQQQVTAAQKSAAGTSPGSLSQADKARSKLTPKQNEKSQKKARYDAALEAYDLPRSSATSYFHSPANLAANSGNEAPTYMPFAHSSSRPDMAQPQRPELFNPLYAAVRPSGLGLGFPGAVAFSSVHPHGHSPSASMPPQFNLGTIFGDSSPSQGSAMKFAHGLLPHQDNAALYAGRSSMLPHNAMAINSFLGHHAHSFDGRPPVSSGMPSFHTHGPHTGGLGLPAPTLNFSMPDH